MENQYTVKSAEIFTAMKTSPSLPHPSIVFRKFRPARTALAGIISLVGLALVHEAQAVTYYWDTNGSEVGSGNATGTWDSGVSALFTQTAGGNVTTTANTTTSADTLTFSAGNGGASVAQQNGTPGTITVSGNQTISTMSLNQSGLTFAGGNITVGTINVSASTSIGSGLVNLTNITYYTTDQTLTLSGGAINLRNIVANGSNSTISRSSSLVLSSGSYTTENNQNTQYNIGNVTAETGGVVINSGATLSQPLGTSSFQIGNGVEGLVTVNSGGNLTITPAGNFLIGRGAGNGGKLIVNGGNVTITNPITIGYAITASSTNTVKVLGGSLKTSSDIGIGAATTNATAASANFLLNISGGTVTTGAAKGVVFGGASGLAASTYGNGTLNMTGGTLYIGTGGITKSGTTNYTIGGINLSGGTIGAQGNWSSSLDMTLGTTNGAITFQSGNQTGTGYNIALSGNLSGTGGLIKSGAGNLTLSGAGNAYGTTTVTAGTLLLSAGGKLGTGSVTVGSGAKLDISGITPTSYAFNNGLGGSGTIQAGTKTVTVNGTLTPGASPGTLTVNGSLTLESNAATTMELGGTTAGSGYDQIAGAATYTLTYGGTMAIVSYGGFDLNTEGTYNLFTGFTTYTGTFSAVTLTGSSGLTKVGTLWSGTNGTSNYTFEETTGTLGIAAVPEPATWVLLAFGLTAVVIFRRRRTA
jgi:hypothetical protein